MVRVSALSAEGPGLGIRPSHARDCSPWHCSSYPGLSLDPCALCYNWLACRQCTVTGWGGRVDLQLSHCGWVRWISNCLTVTGWGGRVYLYLTVTEWGGRVDLQLSHCGWVGWQGGSPTVSLWLGEVDLQLSHCDWVGWQGGSLSHCGWVGWQGGSPSVSLWQHLSCVSQLPLSSGHVPFLLEDGIARQDRR